MSAHDPTPGAGHRRSTMRARAGRAGHHVVDPPLRAFLRHHVWIHTGLGLLGNAAFVVGSILFLWESTKTPGVWLFIVGSSGMLLESIGRAIVNADPDP